MLKKMLFAILLASVAFAVTGQAGLAFTVGLPQGEFRENVDRAGFGISGHLLGFVNPIVGFGVEFGVLSYGSETRREPFSPTIPDVTVEVSRSNNFSYGHLAMQIMPDLRYLKPYAEGRFGFNYLWTDTRIENVGTGEEIASSTNFDDFALTYGGGGGLLIQVWERTGKAPSDDKHPVRKVYIDLKALYMLGGNAEYLKEGSVVIQEDASVIYEVSESRTDLLSINVGVAVEF